MQRRFRLASLPPAHVLLMPHARTHNTPSSADYKHIMWEEAMVTAGELRDKYEKAEDYEDDFM